MMTLTLASTWLVGLLGFAFAAVCLLMTLIILIQKPKGGGLSGAFGGAGGGQSAVFGAKTGDILTWITVSFFVAFLLLGVLLVYATRSDAQSSAVITAPATPEAPEQPAGTMPTPNPADQTLPAAPIDPTKIPTAPAVPEAPATPDASTPQAPQSPAAPETPAAPAAPAPESK